MFQPPFRSREVPSTGGRNYESEITELEGEVERLLLITEALWRILKEKHGPEENDLVREITLIDLEDGRLDGRKPATPPPPRRSRAPSATAPSASTARAASSAANPSPRGRLSAERGGERAGGILGFRRSRR